MKSFVERLLGSYGSPSGTMTEEARIRLANEVDKELHRRKIELVLLYFLGVILAVLLWIFIYISVYEKKIDTEWAKTCLITILGFITGFLSARKQEPAPLSKPPTDDSTAGGGQNTQDQQGNQAENQQGNQATDQQQEGQGAAD